MPQDTPPVLSSGFSTPISVLSESLSFHASPHAFLIQRGQSTDTEKKPFPKAVAARILNRKVAILASHQQCVDVLSAGAKADSSTMNIRKSDNTPVDGTTFAALPAYQQLMADFFPPPNLLLLPYQDHETKRPPWDHHMANVRDMSKPFVQSIAETELSQWTTGLQIDLYESMKTLSWRLLLGVFLGVGPEDTLYQSITTWQEDLLRGQFSLFPVSIRTPCWSSPRSRGIEARRQLQKALLEFFALGSDSTSCPFAAAKADAIENDEMAANVLLFTSSIAVKSLASLLTAFILNLYLFDDGGTTLAEQVRQSEPAASQTLLKSALYETERLSPPIIGVMRRVQKDIVLKQAESTNVDTEASVTVPSGWDAWLYFAGAGRQECDYTNAQQFDPRRFMNATTGSEECPPLPLAFGHGKKTCLGKGLVRDMVQVVARTMIANGIQLEGKVEADGVSAWLGWRDMDSTTSEQMARDMKQLPSQRPREPIQLVVRKTG